MNLNPPKWAIALCAIWPVSVAFTLALPMLSGSPVVSHSYGEAILIAVAWALLLLSFLFRLERWSFAIFTAGVGLWLWIEWVAWQFGSLYPVQGIWDLAAIFGALWCLFGRTVTVSVDGGIKAFVKRSMAVAGIVAVFASAAAYADSFRCESVPDLRAATAQDPTGIWFGTRPAVMPEMRPVRLEFNPDGTGSLATGQYMVARPGGYPTQWLMRGHCLHFGAMMTDYFSQLKACVQLSADGQTLTFSPKGPDGATVFHRDNRRSPTHA